MISFRIEEGISKKIEEIAHREGNPRSSVLRRLVSQGLELEKRSDKHG